MYLYDVQFNGQTAESVGMEVVRRPNIPSPQIRYSTYTIPGRDGTIYGTDGTIEDIDIDIEFNFISNPENWAKALAKAKKWLLSGPGKLIFGDDSDFFYAVKKVELGEAERPCHEIGKFTATFTCEGYRYYRAGEYEYKAIEHNSGTTSHPLYIIRGNGDCILTVNEKKINIKVQDNIIIDTDLMLAYREGGILTNTSISGWYEDAYLKPGKNTVSISDGFDIKIRPRWRCL